MLVPRLTPDSTMSGLRSFIRCLTANITQSVGVPSIAYLVSLTSRARIGLTIDSEWPAPLWLNSGATTQTSLDRCAAISISASSPGAWMPSSLVTRMRARARSLIFTSAFSFGRAGNRREPAHVGTQRLGNRHRAVLVLVVLQDRDQRAADREARAVQRVHEARAPLPAIRALLGPITRIHAARLVIAAVGAARDLAVASLPRQPDLDVEGLARGRAHVAAAQDDGAIRYLQPFQHLLGARGHALVLGGGLLRRGDRDQLDLGELVHADHAARVLAGRTRLGAEARREGGVAQRQHLLVQHRVVGEVGQRQLGGRHQPEAVVGMEHVLGEARQLADPVGGVVAHQQRWVDLGVAALLRGMQVEHELRDGALQSRQLALHEHEARTGDLGRRSKVHLAVRLTQRHMVLRREREVALAAVAADLDVAGLVGAVRHLVEWQVGQHLEPASQLVVELGGLRLAFLQRVLERRDLGHGGVGTFALALGDADLLAELLAPGLDALGFGDGGAAALVDLEDLDRQRRQVALLQARIERGRILADEADIMHG